MPLSIREVSKLRRIIALAETLLDKTEEYQAASRKAKTLISKRAKRKRRTGTELRQFRRLLKSERRRGVPVAKLAREHGVSAAYIYMLP